MSPAPTAPGDPTAMPMLALMNHVRPSRSNGGFSSSCTRSAKAIAWSASQSVSRIPNVSPLNRPTTSVGPRTLEIRCPTSREHPVARGVAEALVDDLEAVDVEEQDRGRLALRAGRRRLERLHDSLDQGLPRRQPGDRVARRERLLLEPGVLERDRGELGELHQRLDLGLSEDPLPGAGRQPDHADRPAADRERHADDRADAPEVAGMRALERVVVVEDDGLARSLKTLPPTPCVTGIVKPTSPAVSPIPARTVTCASPGSPR